MHHKDIKRTIRKQLKKQFSNWKRLKKRQKRDISQKILAEAVAEHDFTQAIEAPMEELLGIEEQIPKGIIKLDEMARFIDMINDNRIIKFNSYKRSSTYIKDEELVFVDRLIDNGIINRILSYDGYRPAMRNLFPSNLFRAELLKAIKYPEISYRKFCTEEYFGLDRKQNRVFMGLPLHKKTMIDHSQLSKFRSNLSFSQQINLLVYILHHFNQSGLLGDCVLHAVDSTELANDCRIPLATVTIKGKKIRIYNDLDCDCGKRRNKRDKSAYVIGYRLHTLTAINAQTGQSYPLVSLLAPANHHDSHFLPFLVSLAQAMGIDVKLITADEAYHDKDGSLYRETGAIVTTPPSAKVALPENVNGDTGAVFCHDECSIPMGHVGHKSQEHEYKCGASTRECSCSQTCPQHRFIPMDGGVFQRIPFATKMVQQAHEIRKNCERPFNLLKNQTGLETVRVRSQRATMARCTLSSIAVILIKMAGSRKKKSTNQKQLQSLFANAA
ncbi:MAG: transposase [Deltaproteobacteria bacterium]|nr:transposase [Candidatus Desulfobacula maris]